MAAEGPSEPPKAGEMPLPGYAAWSPHELQAKLAEMGAPTQGSREELVERLQTYTLQTGIVLNRPALRGDDGDKPAPPPMPGQLPGMPLPPPPMGMPPMQPPPPPRPPGMGLNFPMGVGPPPPPPGMGPPLRMQSVDPSALPEEERLKLAQQQAAMLIQQEERVKQAAALMEQERQQDMSKLTPPVARASPDVGSGPPGLPRGNPSVGSSNSIPGPRPRGPPPPPGEDSREVDDSGVGPKIPQALEKILQLKMEKILTKEDQAPTGAPGTSATPVGQVSVVSLSPPPTQEPSTLMAATSMISHPTSRSRDSRTHSKTQKSRRGSKGTYPTHQTKGGGKGQHHHKRKHRRMTLRELLRRAWRETVPYLVALRSIIYNLTQSMFFDIFIGTVVAINNILLVAQTFAVVEIRGEWFFSAMDPVFLSVYVVEAILKIVALGVDYFRDPWNDTDFFIMIMTVLDFVLPLFISSRQGNRGNTVTLFRVLKICKGIRAIRAIRFLLTLRVMENVREVTSTFMLSCQSIGAIIIVMFTLLFMSSVVMRDMFCDADPAHFGDIFKTIFTLFQLFTLDDWSLIYLTCYDAGAWYVIIFLIVYILVQYFLLLNLVIAVLVDNFQVALLKRQELQKQKKLIQPEDSTKEDGPSSKPAEKGKKREEREEEFFRRMVMEKYGNLELAEREWQLLYKYFQLMTAIETHQQQFHSQSSTTDKILDTFFETAQQDDLPK